MEIVRARPEDAATLRIIAFAAKRHWGYSERWIESWRDALTVQPDFMATHETYSAVVENRTVGFYVLGCTGDRLNLQHLWVLPSAMGQGVGRWRDSLVNCRFWFMRLTKWLNESRWA